MDIAAPFAKTGVISVATNLWLAVPIGIVFGYALFHAGFTDSRRIAWAFYFKDVGVPVESWILREDAIGGDGKMLPAGTWMLTTRVTKDDAWERVKAGELTGYSIVYQGIHEGVHGA